MAKIMIVDDDETLLGVLEFALSREGFEPVCIADSRKALDQWRRETPDLVILDANMPEKGGFEILQIARSEMNTPVVMLTARAAEADMAQAFISGADDYVTKPFSPQLLIARINAILRRTAPGAGQNLGVDELEIGNLKLNPHTQEFINGTRQVRLTPIEYRLMHLLLLNPNKIVKSETIIDRVWGFDARESTGSLKAHIRHMREKVEDNPSRPQIIVTVPGVGYMAKLPSS
jgi:two-component system response regulator VicR